MNDEAVRLLLSKAKTGDKDALEKLESHLLAVRDLVAELAEGLDDEELQDQVNEALGWDEDELEGEAIAEAEFRSYWGRKKA